MQAVIPKLIDYGHTVVGVDSLMRYKKRLGHANVDYKFSRVDLSDYVATARCVDEVDPDVIIQAAALIYGVGGFHRYGADILTNDITLHRNVLMAARNSNVQRVVYISSSMVYEKCVQDVNVPVAEWMPDHAPAPETDYGLSKFVGERLSRSYMTQYGLPFTIWRPFNIITPYEKSGSLDNGISHVFADFIRNIVDLRKNPLPLIGNGEQVRCFTWIHEVADAIARYSFDLNTQNETFNLGNPEPITMRQLAEIIHDTAIMQGLIPASPLVFAPNVQNFKDDVRVRIPDVRKAKDVLGWEAEIEVRESVAQCLKSLVNK